MSHTHSSYSAAHSSNACGSTRISRLLRTNLTTTYVITQLGPHNNCVGLNSRGVLLCEMASLHTLVLQPQPARSARVGVCHCDALLKVSHHFQLFHTLICIDVIISSATRSSSWKPLVLGRHIQRTWPPSPSKIF